MDGLSIAIILYARSSYCQLVAWPVVGQVKNLTDQLSGFNWNISFYLTHLSQFLCICNQNKNRYGRWKVLVPTGALQMVFAVGCGFVQNYYIYVVLRFLIAVNVSGAYMIGFVLSNKKIVSKPELRSWPTRWFNILLCKFSYYITAMEMAPDRYRTMIGFSFQLVFALGIAVVAGWAYLIRHWPILQIIFGLHSSLMLLHWWYDIILVNPYVHSHSLFCL